MRCLFLFPLKTEYEMEYYVHEPFVNTGIVRKKEAFFLLLVFFMMLF